MEKGWKPETASRLRKEEKYMQKIFESFFAAVDKVFFGLSALVLAGMTVLITVQVICRFILHAPLAWSEEAARFGFIWMTFFAGYVGERSSQHISVELVQNLFPAGVKKGMKSISAVIAGGFFLMVAYYLVSLWGKLSTQTSAALRVPMSYVYLGMLVGCFFMGLSYLYDAVKILLWENRKEENK